MNEQLYALEQSAVFRVKQLQVEAKQARFAKQAQPKKSNLKKLVGKSLVSLGLRLARA